MFWKIWKFKAVLTTTTFLLKSLVGCNGLDDYKMINFLFFKYDINPQTFDGSHHHKYMRDFGSHKVLTRF